MTGLGCSPETAMTGARVTPLIVEAARRIRTQQFVLDGEAVLLGVDGISDFDGLYSGKHNDEVQLYAFDILALDGDALRKLPLHLRKNNLARLLARRADGIHLAPFEQGEIGPDLFKAACDMMLEGLVSKRRDSRYRAGPSRDIARFARDSKSLIHLFTGWNVRRHQTQWG